MLRLPLSFLICLAVVPGARAFAPPPTAFSSEPLSSSALMAASRMDRRAALGSAAALVGWSVTATEPAHAAATDVKTVALAGATGQTGRRILERLAGSDKGLNVVAGVRNVDKAAQSLSESSTVIRGAMVQQVASVDTSAVDLKHLDIVQDDVAALTQTLRGADALVIAVGFVPGNPLKMNDEAHKVDNVGTCKLIDAAKAAGVSKVVMVSSILTNGRNWGQEKSPGFLVTNAFGQVLDEKIVAENHLRASGLDYTIVRPGGLKAKPRKFGSSLCGTSGHSFTGLHV